MATGIGHNSHNSQRSHELP